MQAPATLRLTQKKSNDLASPGSAIADTGTEFTTGDSRQLITRIPSLSLGAITGQIAIKVIGQGDETEGCLMTGIIVSRGS
jgi:hypothetical protein